MARSEFDDCATTTTAKYSISIFLIHVSIPYAAYNCFSYASTSFNRNSAVILNTSAPFTANNTCDTNGSNWLHNWAKGKPVCSSASGKENRTDGVRIAQETVDD